MTAFSRALDDGLDATLSRPRAAALVTLAGLVAALFGVAVSPIAGAIAIVILFAALVALFLYALRQRALYEGPYRVESDKTVWDLVDPTGQMAVVEQTLKVVFNYPSIAIDDHARGDGDLFADYECDFGQVVHQTREADTERVIVALDDRQQRGSSKTLVSRRTIRDGFLQDREWAKLTLDKPTRRSEFLVIFPEARPPSRVWLSRNGNKHDLPVESEGGRSRVRRVLKKPKAGQTLLIEWDW